MKIEFFIPMAPPETTQQMHKIAVRGGKPCVYDPAQVKLAKAKLTDSLAARRPQQPLCGAVRLVVKWCFPRGKHRDGAYRITPPDTDNLQKMLKDVMTRLRFWKDDAQVASEIVEKFWAQIPGLYVCASEIGGDADDQE